MQQENRMHKIIVMRGAPGSGKSTLLEKHGLTYYTVSPDLARLMLAGPEMDVEGRIGISQQHNQEAWRMCKDILAQRMRRGETLAFDATLPTESDLRGILEIAKRYRYEVLIVNMYSVPEEQAHTQNQSRPEPKRVPDYVVHRVYEMYRNDIATRDKREIMWSVNGDHNQTIKRFLEVPVEDLSKYRAVVHLSDNQGCHGVMFEEGSPLKDGLLDDVFYIHHGDLIDRGTEHSAVLRWAVEQMRTRENFVLLRGNHETHLVRHLDGEEPVSKEFATRTLPEMIAAGITNDEISTIVKGMRDVFIYRHHGTKVLCTHAGLPLLPERPELISSEQYQKGPGQYESDVDAAFTTWSLNQQYHTEEIVYQVHGHRNSHMLPVQAGDRSINLEGQVEFGGHMRFATKHSDGFETQEVRNHTFRTMAEVERERLADPTKPRARPGSMPVPSWVSSQGSTQEYKVNKDLIETMRRHPMINERPSQVLPHVSAFNFKREAFEDGNWDSVSLRARGMFIDVETGNIVARSYEKFFNWGERPETSTTSLKQTLKFPVTAFRKENGYLGIAGYDERTKSLVLTSKSVMDSNFSVWFRNILERKLEPAGMERLLRYLRDTRASAIFEVIDPVNDPHIVEYESENVVLLDVVARKITFEKLDYADLRRVAQILGVDVKVKTTVLQGWEDLVGFVDRVTTNTLFRENRMPVEGYVLEDTNGSLVKIKSGWYTFWKRMRSLRDRLASDRRNRSTTTREPDEASRAFHEFCSKQPDVAFDLSIIDLRKTFESNPSHVFQGPTSIIAVKSERFTGFLMGLSSVAKNVREGRGRYDTVRKMLDSIAGDAGKTEVVRENEDYKDLVHFANFGYRNEKETT